jgi:hypothetical protein
MFWNNLTRMEMGFESQFYFKPDIIISNPKQIVSRG